MKRLLLLTALLFCASKAQAGAWTWNVGYHNPAVSTFGLNLLWFGSEFGFEAGIGWIDVSSVEETNGAKKKSSTKLNIAGDVDGKYFLTSGKFRPYLQAGFGIGFGATTGDDAGASAGTGGGFGGIGLLIGSPDFYAYGSFNMNGSKETFAQAGIGAGL